MQILKPYLLYCCNEYQYGWDVKSMKDLDLYPALMAIENLGFFSMPIVTRGIRLMVIPEDLWDSQLLRRTCWTVGVQHSGLTGRPFRIQEIARGSIRLSR